MAALLGAAPAPSQGCLLPHERAVDILPGGLTQRVGGFWPSSRKKEKTCRGWKCDVRARNASPDFCGNGRSLEGKFDHYRPQTPVASSAASFPADNNEAMAGQPDDLSPSSDIGSGSTSQSSMNFRTGALLYQASKWAVFFSLAAFAFQLARTTFASLLNPTTLMFASWFLVIWPWPVAILLGLLALFSAMAKGKPSIPRQVVQLVGALTWLILVPCAHFQGLVDGWPLFLFATYFFFFCISAIVRFRLYGSLAAKERDQQWATPTSRAAQVGFIVSVVAGHWLAAKEAQLLQMSVRPSLPLLPLLLLFLSITLHWSSSFFLGKYFDRLVLPPQLVTVGPYRWTRHPLYSSYMLLFSSFCLALHSYKSLVLLLTACLTYYLYRTKLEEEVLVRGFGEEYVKYRERTPKKFLPFVL